MGKAFPTSPASSSGKGSTEISVLLGEEKGLRSKDGMIREEGRSLPHFRRLADFGDGAHPPAWRRAWTTKTIHRSQQLRHPAVGPHVCTAVSGPRSVTPHALRAQPPRLLQAQPRSVRQRRAGVACSLQWRPTRLLGLPRGCDTWPCGGEPGRPWDCKKPPGRKREEGQAEGKQVLLSFLQLHLAAAPNL